MKLSELEHAAGIQHRVKAPDGRTGIVSAHCPAFPVGGRMTPQHWHIKQDDGTEFVAHDGEIILDDPVPIVTALLTLSDIGKELADVAKGAMDPVLRDWARDYLNVRESVLNQLKNER